MTPYQAAAAWLDAQPGTPGDREAGIRARMARQMAVAIAGRRVHNATRSAPPPTRNPAQRARILAQIEKHRTDKAVHDARIRHLCRGA